MKHLGRIEIGGSLDITNNKHVEDLIEETLKGIDIPEDTNTTYTLTQDGLTVQLVDDLGNAVSEIEIPKLEDKNTTYTLTRDGTTIQLEGSEGGSSEVDIAPLIPPTVDPYQEVKGIALPTVNLFDTLRSRDYDDFDIYLEFDEANDRISIYLHLRIGVDIETFTLADNVSNLLDYYNRDGDGDVEGSMVLVGVGKYTDGSVVMRGEYGGNLTLPPKYGGGRGILLERAAVQPAEDSPLNNHYDGIVLYSFSSPYYFVFPDVDYETVSDQRVITGTLEEHLQNIYGHIYNS